MPRGGGGWGSQRPHTEDRFSSVQSLSRVWLFATPWTTARRASLSVTLRMVPRKPFFLPEHCLTTEQMDIKRKPRKLPAIIVPQTVSKNPYVCRGHKKCVYSLSLRSPVTRRDEVIRVTVAHSGLREKFKGQTTVLWWLKTPGVVISVFRRVFTYCH